MNCIFKCGRQIEAPSFPMCEEDLKKFGLELFLIPMKALVQKPRGLGPYFTVLPNMRQPRLYFRMGPTITYNEEALPIIRSMYIPSFKKNHVIFHTLGFSNFLGDRSDCPSIEPVQFDVLERMRQIQIKDNPINHVIEEQTEAQRILTTQAPASPVASRFLVELIEGFLEVLRSGVFAAVGTSADILHYNQEIFTIKYPDFLNNMASTTFSDFNMRNTIWLGIIYHTFPEEISYQQDILLNSGYNCELVKNVGLVTTRDIYPGEFLILKGKKMTLNDLMCFLPPPTEPAIMRGV